VLSFFSSRQNWDSPNSSLCGTYSSCGEGEGVDTSVLDPDAKSVGFEDPDPVPIKMKKFHVLRSKMFYLEHR
jgi:hypothetical protein